MQNLKFYKFSALQLCSDYFFFCITAEKAVFGPLSESQHTPFPGFSSPLPNGLSDLKTYTTLQIEFFALYNFAFSENVCTSDANAVLGP